MNNWFSFFHKVIVVSVASVGTMLSTVLPKHHQALPSFHPSVTPSPTVIEKTITIDKTITEAGKHVILQLQMPENGGTLNGSISGDCQGTIDGIYTGSPAYHLNGNGEVNCTVGLLSLPASIIFNGEIHPASQTAAIDYTITSGSNFSKTGNVSIPYTE